MFGQWSFIIAAIAVEGVRGLYLDGSARSFNLSGRALAALLVLDGWGSVQNCRKSWEFVPTRGRGGLVGTGEGYNLPEAHLVVKNP